jgi:hypothetical protein
METNKRKISLFCFMALLFLLSLSQRIKAQESLSDSIFSAKLMEDNLALYNRVDSLEGVIQFLHTKKLALTQEVDSLQQVINIQSKKLLQSGLANDSMMHEQVNLNRTILANKQAMLKLNTDLEEKSQLLRDKDYQLTKSELELKDLKSNSEINEVKLEGKLEAHNSKMEGKDKEISYLKKSNEEKDLLIKDKTRELSNYYRQKDNSIHIIDSLSRSLSQKELDYSLVSGKLNTVEGKYNEMLEKQAASTNRKKKIRFVQGVGVKNFRTPDWQVAQKSSTSNELVISNKNAGLVDVDYVSGVSISLLDLTDDNAKFTTDLGIFVGFGGQNLFKNFYIGPSLKVFDFFHLSGGTNFSEYQLLKPGVKEGDPCPYGLAPVLVNQWKTKLFVGLSIDLELLANISSRF